MRFVTGIALALCTMSMALALPFVEDSAHITKLLARADTILPTPQRVSYSAGTWQVQAGKVFVVGGSHSKPAVYDTELVQRLSTLFTEKDAVKVASGDEKYPEGAVIVAIGSKTRNAFIKTRVQRWKIQPPPDYPGRQGYSIRCREEEDCKVIVGVGWDVPGEHYAAQSIIQLFGKRDGKVVFRPAEVDDWPAVAWRGAKVGGIPASTSNEELQGIARGTVWLYAAKFNAVHLQAPKTKVYEQKGGRLWRSPTEGYKAFVIESARYASKHAMHTMQMVCPFIGTHGQHSQDSQIVLTDTSDLDALENTFRLSIDNGGDSVMICMDDFCPFPQGPYYLTNEEDKARFRNIGEAALFLTNEMASRLRKIRQDLKVFLCPPWYSTLQINMIGDDKSQALELGKKLSADIPIVWSGPIVRSMDVTDKDIEEWSRLTGRARPFYWENTFYQRRNGAIYIFFDEMDSAYPKDLPQRVEGWHINNSRNDDIALCGLMDRSKYLWNPAAYDPRQSLGECMEMFCGRDAIEPILAFRETFYKLYSIIPPFQENSKLKEKNRPLLIALAPQLRMQLEEISRKCWNTSINHQLEELVKFYERRAAEVATERP